VVSYHFGNKAALVEAIFHYRLPGIEARRRTLLDEATREGNDSSAYHLLRALWLPLFEQVNDDGAHSYAGFMAALMQSTMGGVRTGLNTEYPVANELAGHLRQTMPAPARGHFDSRVLVITLMVTGTLQLIDQTRPSKRGANLFEDTLRMASAALLAPVGERTS
jgi:AcrR family transcriptional regulator